MRVGFLMGFGRQKLTRNSFELYPRLHKIGLYLKFFEQVETLYIISPKYGILSDRDKVLPYPQRFPDLSLSQKTNFFYDHKQFLNRFKNAEILFVGDILLFPSLKALCPKATHMFADMKIKHMYTKINKALQSCFPFFNLFEGECRCKKS